MTKNIYIILLVCINFQTFAQNFGESEGCHKNAMNPLYYNLPPVNRIPVIEATFKTQLTKIDGRLGNCTGTLINRNTSDGQLGFYFITARHCFFRGENVDLNALHSLYFNYQSPDAHNGNVAQSNQGNNVPRRQSTNLTHDNYQYHHRTRLRLVADYWWGDFALVEILTPLPPHFNYTFAGWHPGRLGTIINTSPSGAGVNVHHPKGDIKKISGTSTIVWGQTPVATGCYTITKVIDVLFGWIWRRRIQTQVICRYMDNPYLTVGYFDYGGVEKGSSGSSIFNNSNQSMGVLAFGAGVCGFRGLVTYGKLQSNYPNAAVRNTLNPSHELAVDWYGMPPRKIFCYPNLTLPGAMGVSGEYFPASHYQPNNRINLRAEHHITTNQDLHIHSGADYTFTAGQSIELNEGFEVDAGANFTARVEVAPCNTRKSATASAKDMLLYKLSNTKLPDYQSFDPDKYKKPKGKAEKSVLESKIIAYPNPTSKEVTLVYDLGQEEKVSLYISNLLGEKVITVLKDMPETQGQHEVVIDVSQLEAGMYIYTLQTSEGLESKRLVIVR